VTKRLRTPQEKKRLSLAHDRRNTYGNNTKAARKVIPRKKRRAARAERHHTNAALSSEVRVADADLIVGLPIRVRGAKHRQWRKGPDQPLGEVIAKQTEKQTARYGRKVRARAKRVLADDMPPNKSLERTRGR
jgi:hypothetical protein